MRVVIIGWCSGSSSGGSNSGTSSGGSTSGAGVIAAVDAAACAQTAAAAADFSSAASKNRGSPLTFYGESGTFVASRRMRRSLLGVFNLIDFANAFGEAGGRWARPAASGFRFGRSETGDGRGMSYLRHAELILMHTVAVALPIHKFLCTPEQNVRNAQCSLVFPLHPAPLLLTRKFELRQRRAANPNRLWTRRPRCGSFAGWARGWNEPSCWRCLRRLGSCSPTGLSTPSRAGCGRTRCWHTRCCCSRWRAEGMTLHIASTAGSLCAEATAGARKSSSW